jgi:D-alanine-D-alanine ligase
MSAKLRVAVVFGGRSGEHEVSLVSAASISRALDRTRYEVTLIGIDKTGRWVLPERADALAHASDPRALDLSVEARTASLVPFSYRPQVIALDGAHAAAGAFDVVFPVLHGPHGEDGTIQGLLELAGIPYVGSGVLGSALGMDKDASRRLLRDAGIPVVPFQVVRAREFERAPDAVLAELARRFGYPYFVKPANLGSSVGVHKVKRAGEARALLADALSYDTKVLVELAVDARELECGVLGNAEPRASVVGEVIPRHEFYSYEAKYLDPQGADLRIPAGDLAPETGARVQALACQAFLALECHGMARVDFFLDRASGALYLNEVNTIPGFTPISMYPKLWEASGIPYPRLLDELIRLALERHAERARLRSSYEP